MDHRSLPRRRGSELTDAIFEAVLKELETNGFAGLTMDAVASRARTGKASLYRRWPSKVELVMDVVYDRLPAAQFLTDTGSLRGDILAMFKSVQEELSGPIGEALRGLRGESLVNPEARKRVSDYTRDAALESLRELVARAVNRGELPANAVTELRLAAGPALLRNHFLFNPSEPFSIENLVDEVVLPLLQSTVP